MKHILYLQIILLHIETTRLLPKLSLSVRYNLDRLPQIAKKLEKEKKVKLPKALLEYRRKKQNGYRDCLNPPQLPTVKSILNNITEKRNLKDYSPARSEVSDSSHLRTESASIFRSTDKRSSSLKMKSLEKSYDKILSFTLNKPDISPLSDLEKSNNTFRPKSVARLTRISKLV